MSVRVVFADANILFSRTLRDYVLYMAGEGAIEVHWSQQILEEMSRNLRAKIGITKADTDRLEDLMNAYLDEALIAVDPESWAVAGAVAMDPKDRHVLAAALSTEADVLLTQNTKDFPRVWMQEHGMELLTAGELLAYLSSQAPRVLRAAHEKTVYFSPKSEAAVLATLEAIVGPSVVDTVRAVVQSMPREP